jgi:hypothetical protein
MPRTFAAQLRRVSLHAYLQFLNATEQAQLRFDADRA